MKKLLTLYFAFCTILLFGQDDQQWLIKQGMLKTGYGLFNPPTSGTNHYTHNIEAPCSTPLVLGGFPRNDFFIIYQSGDFWMSDPDINPSLQPDSKTDPNTEIISYAIDNDNPIEYMYLTNVYEGDDPVDTLLLESTYNPNISLDVVPLNNSLANDSHYRLTNHGFLNGRDVTFIFDRRDMKCSEITLCANKKTDEVILHPKPFPGRTSHGLYKDIGGAGLLEANPITFDVNNCITLDVSTEETISYYNFEVEIVKLDNKNPKFLFEKNQGEAACNFSYQDIDMNNRFHDPNYVELKCITKENGIYKGIYRVECFNDGDAIVNIVDLEVKLPSTVHFNTVKFLNWQANKKKGFGLVQLSNLSSGNMVKVRFPTWLNVGPKKNNKNTAWFEFKVDFKNTVDVLDPNVDLSCTDAFSSFQSDSHSDTYCITDFFEHTHCLKKKDRKKYSQYYSDLENLTLLNVIASDRPRRTRNVMRPRYQPVSSRDWNIKMRRKECILARKVGKCKYKNFKNSYIDYYKEHEKLEAERLKKEKKVKKG